MVLQFIRWQKAKRKVKNMNQDLDKYIRSIPDFPKKGINFRDITTLLKDPRGLKEAVQSFEAALEGVDFDVVVGPEARGFLFGVPVAYNLGKGFVPVRKPGKLPGKTISQSYDLEYGTNEIEVHDDAVQPGQRVVVIDDLMATGGTIEAIIKLINRMGAEVVKVVCLIELEGFNAKDNLGDIPFESLIKYPGA